MKRGYNSKRIYKVRLKSGQWGERYRLCSLYTNFSEFAIYCRAYGNAKRLGGTPKSIWRKNPIIQVGVEPSDYQIVKVK